MCVERRARDVARGHLLLSGLEGLLRSAPPPGWLDQVAQQFNSRQMSLAELLGDPRVGGVVWCGVVWCGGCMDLAWVC